MDAGVSDQSPVDVEVDVTGARGVPPEEVAEARGRMEQMLRRNLGRPPQAARIALRSAAPSGRRAPLVADATVLLDGRVLAAHVTGRTPLQAVDEAAERIRRQLRRTVDADVALRNEPRVLGAAIAALPAVRAHGPEAALKPPEERRIIHRRSVAPEPRPTLSAVADLLDLDLYFYLFVHARTGEDVVVHRRDDGRVALLHPVGSVLADEDDDLVATQPSRYTEPLTLPAAREEMDMLNHRFLYFQDADDGRGKALYLRHDGDYGLMEPA